MGNYHDYSSRTFSPPRKKPGSPQQALSLPNLIPRERSRAGRLLSARREGGGAHVLCVSHVQSHCPRDASGAGAEPGQRSSEGRVEQLRRFGEGGVKQRGSEARRGGLQVFAGIVLEGGRRTGGCRGVSLKLPQNAREVPLPFRSSVCTAPHLWQ